MGRGGIQKAETYNLHGGTERKVEIQALGDQSSFIRVKQRDAPMGEVCIDGMFVYTMRNKPMEEVHTRTEAYIGARKALDSRFCAKVPHWDVGDNASAHTSQLQSLSVLISAIS